MSVFVLKEAVLSSQWFGVSLILIGIAIPQIAYAMRGRGRYRKHHTHKNSSMNERGFSFENPLLLYTYSKDFAEERRHTTWYLFQIN